jgi:hypothetical protein
LVGRGFCSSELHRCLPDQGGALAGKERNGKVQKRSLDPKYTIQVGFTGDSIIWTRQKIDISNTLLVGIANTTGLGCWDSLSQYILL